MRIAFAGTPEFAATSLEALLAAESLQRTGLRLAVSMPGQLVGLGNGHFEDSLIRVAKWSAASRWLPGST